jgi:hypothetical protein
MKNIAVALFLVAASLVYAQSAPLCETPSGENRFGVVDHLTWAFLYSPEEIDRALEMMVTAGIGWVRLNWSWKDFQPAAGSFQFEQFDLVASRAAEYGIHLLPILTAVPAWASTAPAELIAERGNLAPVDRYRPRNLEDWLLYVQTVVERYDGDGIEDAPGSPRISHWEVWNEPNLALFWPPQPDAGEYTALLRTTYEEVVSADPFATVVLGGLSGADDSYLQAVYDAGGAPYFDVLSIHLYTHPALGTIEGIQTALESMRNVLNANGDTGVPIWLTEIGWSDAPNAWGQPTASQTEIAAFLSRVYSTPLPADIIFWYNFRNIFDSSADVEHNFGMIYNNFSPKPAYTAYVEVANQCSTSSVQDD